jgi:hypothetical protein
MCALLLWLWVCFAGGVGALLGGEFVLGFAAIGAGLVTLAYLGTPDPGKRWLIRAGLVLLWFAGGLLLWDWKVEDWGVAGRIAFGVLGGRALLAYLLRRAMGAETRRMPPPQGPPAPDAPPPPSSEH